MKDADKLLQTIREQNIQPRPKLWFSFRNWAIWLGFAFSVLLGAAAFSVLMYSVQQTDFSVLQHLRHSKLEMLLGLLPFFWLVFLLVALVSAFISYQHSPRGYKISIGRLAAYNFALSAVLGALFFIGGGAQKLDSVFETHLSLYESVQEKKVKLWSVPEQGYLSGKVLTASATEFELEDFEQKHWVVDYSGAFVPPIVQLEPGESVKLIGKMQGEGRFKADEVRPWGGQQMRMQGRGK